MIIRPGYYDMNWTITVDIVINVKMNCHLNYVHPHLSLFSGIASYCPIVSQTLTIHQSELIIADFSHAPTSLCNVSLGAKCLNS